MTSKDDFRDLFSLITSGDYIILMVNKLMVKLIMQNNKPKSKDIKYHPNNINNLVIDDIKTTNINILLNRVKIDKKKL